MPDDQHKRFGCPLPSGGQTPPYASDTDTTVFDQMMDMAVRLHWLAGRMKDPAKQRAVRTAADQLYAMVGPLLDTR